jgi:hypothetical protein
MVLDPHHAIAGEQGDAPRALRQPADAPPPLGHVGGVEPVQSLSRVWAGRRDGAGRPASLRGTVRAWLGRISGRSDRRLLFALADATEAIAAHCDLLGDRLAVQEAVTADVAGAFGEEITSLRAEVLHLQRLVMSLHDAPDD